MRKVSPRKLCVILFDNWPTDTFVLQIAQSREEKKKKLYSLDIREYVETDICAGEHLRDDDR